MGIREEIEKLKVPGYDPCAYLINCRINDVLSILDEHLGELLIEVSGEDWLCPPADDVLDDLDIKPGDSLSIYVRRKG